MLSKNKCSYYTNRADNSIIPKIKNMLEQQTEIIDFTVFSDSVAQGINHEYSVLPSYYLAFYRGIVVFDNEDDLNSKKTILGSNHTVYLYKNEELNNVI